MTPRLLDRFYSHARRRPDAVAYARAGDPDSDVTYGFLAGAASSLACELSARIAPGEVVLLVAPDGAEFACAFLATLAAGGRVFALSCETGASDLRAAAVRSRAVGVIGNDAALGALAGEVRFSLPVSDLTARAGAARLLARDTARGGMLLQSSGTTAAPKIVYRSTASLDAVSDAMVDAIGFREGDRVLTCLPLCHSYGVEHGLLAPVFAGSAVHLVHRFDFNTVRAQLRDGGVTIFPGVPFMFEALARAAGGDTLPSLRRAYSAGGPLPRSVYDAFYARYGVRVSQLYGATEIGSVTYSDPLEQGFDPASVGRAMKGVELRIIEAAAGGEGQVAVRAPSMLAGYVPDEPPATVDGFYLTGDLGRIDAFGNLTVTGRTKLLIDVGGLKVNPLEVEEVLCQHPSVARCVVLPVRVSETVSRLKAIVTPRDGAAPPAPEALRQFARGRLLPYKVPRLFEVRDTLPVSPTGKVLRHMVAA